MSENQHIENFLKKRLESHSFDFREDDWDKLEIKLNQAKMGLLNQSWRVNVIKGVLLSGIVLVAFVAGWLGNQLFSTNPVVTEKISTIAIQPIEKRKVEEAIHNNTISNIKLSKGQVDEVKRINEENALKSVDIKEVHAVNENTGDNAAGMKQADFKDVNKRHEKYTDFDKQNHSFVFIEKSTRKQSLYNKPEGPEIQVDFTDMKPMEPVDAKQFVISIQNSLEFSNSAGTNVTTMATMKKPPVFMHKFSIGLTVSPDLNSIGFMNEAMLTARAGGALYFDVTNRLTISSGIFYSNKKYNTRAENYEPGRNYWVRRTNGILPDNIFGTCNVVDVPINIKYKLFYDTRNALGLSAGVSSYFLQDEYYDFEFKDVNPGAADGWETTDNTMSAFSVLNFSMGYERLVYRRISLLLEPAIQLPYKKIGWGNVNLVSMGLQTTLKYRL